MCISEGENPAPLYFVMSSRRRPCGRYGVLLAPCCPLHQVVEVFKGKPHGSEGAGVQDFPWAANNNAALLLTQSAVPNFSSTARGYLCSGSICGSVSSAGITVGVFASLPPQINAE